MSRNRQMIISALKTRGFTGEFELFFWHQDGWYCNCDQMLHDWIGQNVKHVLKEIESGKYDSWIYEKMQREMSKKNSKTRIVSNGNVLSYNANPHKRTSFMVTSGDKLEWKRNGSCGHVNAIVIGFSQDKPDHVFVENWKQDWTGPYEKRSKVWIKKRSVLRVKQ